MTRVHKGFCNTYTHKPIMKEIRQTILHATMPEANGEIALFMEKGFKPILSCVLKHLDQQGNGITSLFSTEPQARKWKMLLCVMVMCI